MNPESIVAYFGIKEGMKVADFGCGSGYFTILMGKLAGENGTITAVDVLNSALETVRAKAKGANLKNIDTVRSNLEIPGSSGLALESQDMVLLANILFQSNKREDIFKEAKRVLKPSGSLIVIDWKKGTNGFGPSDNHRLNPEELRRTVSDMGFQFSDFIDAGVFHFGIIFRKK